MRAQHGRKIAKIKLTPVAITFGAVESKIFYEVGERRRTWRRERGGKGGEGKRKKVVKTGRTRAKFNRAILLFSPLPFPFYPFPGNTSR